MSCSDTAEDIVLLEGVVLTDVAEGKYLLSAAPLNLAGCDGRRVGRFWWGEKRCV